MVMVCCRETDLSVLDGVRIPLEHTAALNKWTMVGEVLIPGVLNADDIDKTNGYLIERRFLSQPVLHKLITRIRGAVPAQVHHVWLRYHKFHDKILETLSGGRPMSNSDFTKFMIARGLKQLLETKSFLDISVGDIAQHCKISRNTFYYHFRDKYDVISWVFYTEITPLIGETLSIEKWGC